MSVLDRKLLRDMARIWLQAVAIALVIGSGVAMYVMSLGTVGSLEEARAVYYERYRFADVFATVKRAPERLATQIAAIPGVARVETRIAANVTLDVAGLAEPALGLLVSVPDHHEPLLNALHLRRGRGIEPDRADDVVLNEPFAEAHGLGPGDHLFAIVNGRKRRLEVAGVALSPEFIYSIGPGAMMPDNERFGVIWIGRDTLAAAYGLDGAFNAVSVALLRGASRADVIAGLDRLLEPYGGIGAYGRKDQTSHWYISNELTQLESMANVLSPIFLGVAAFLLQIVVSRLVATEREQIGLLKAFGYSGRAIAWHYSKLVLAIVTLGVIFGFAGGIWLGRGLTELYTEFFRFPFLYYRPDPAVFAIAALISLGVGWIATLGAVRRAAALPPAVAMQPAPPLIYRKTFLERLHVVTRLAQPTRMIVRHMLRHPVRAGLTSLGIAMSVAILVSAMSMTDMVEFVVDVQFNRVQRQDITISLAEGGPMRLVRDLENLPGVLRVEPLRVVPVRLRNGHLSRRTGIIGLDPAGDLNRLLDTDLRSVSLPAEGLVLSKKLAEVLAIRRGDRLRVEVMEGRRPARAIPVTAIVEEFLGNSAYMALPALNRLMDDGAAVSAAHLMVDSRDEAALYRELKETPAVAGVTIVAVALQSFRDTLAESLLLMTTFNVMFAGMIAFGVVYNNARISLSERGRELASLRVLGFTRFEVSWILLGEFAVLTVAALPPGWLIGYGLAWLMTVGLENELFRFPLVVERATYGYAALVVLASALLTGLLVRRRIDRLDLVSVLKTRE